MLRPPQWGFGLASGGRHEPANLNGISHFIEHMLFKGTSRRSARRIMEEVEGVGGDLNAYTSEERTCYYAAAAAEFFPRLCDVLCDLYMNPRFALQDIERERGVICEEILMYRDEPSSHVQEILNGHFWPNHPLGRPLTGTPDTVESLQRDDLLSYRASHYHAGSTVVSSAGKIRHQEVIDRASKLLEKIPSATGPSAKSRHRITGARHESSLSAATCSKRRWPWVCRARVIMIPAAMLSKF